MFTQRHATKPNELDRPNLDFIVRMSDTVESFITAIQFNSLKYDAPNLLSDLYDWEQSTPENKVRFKNTGWFGIASTFWNEKHSLSPDFQKHQG